jgi:hypothetical protein
MSNLYWSGRELADEIEWFCCVRGDKEGDRLKLSVATIRQAKDGRVLDIQFTPEAEALRVNP